MVRFHARGLLALLVVLGPVSATAQTRIFALFASPECTPLGCRPGTLLDIDAERGTINGTAPITPWTAGQPAVTPDGRYLVFPGYRSPGAHLDALDISSYAVSSFPVTASGPTFGHVVHPAVPRAYFQRPEDEQIFVVDAVGGLRSLPATASGGLGMLRAISRDGSRLFTVNSSPAVVVIDSVTGATLAAVSDAGGILATNADGTEIYTSAQPVGVQFSLQRRRVETGAVLAATAVDLGVTVTRDPRTGHLWVKSDHLLRVLDGTTLATIAERPFAFAGRAVRLAFDPEHPLVYIGWKSFSPRESPPHFTVLNTETMTIEVEADVPMPDLGILAGLVLGPRPPRVEALSAAVNGPTVTLSWVNVASQGLATQLIVEAGSAPGLRNLARFVVPPGQTTLVVPGVPSGRYFVRVRSANGTGEGTASNEVIVTVP